MTRSQPAPSRPAPRQDPRLYQIGVLAVLLLYGVGQLDFDVSPARVGLTMCACLAAQYLCTRVWALPRFNPLSAGISGLSLCLLLRTDRPELVLVAALVTIASKFVCRVDGRHLFNPTNFGLVVMLAATGEVWVSPGQWGSLAVAACLLARLGGLVVHRAERADVTYAFLAAYGLLVVGRAMWLGDPLSIPWFHLQSGGLLLFAFLMISDPKTTPNARAGRICFAALVASGGPLVEFGLHRPNGLLWSLAAAAPLTVVINQLLPGPRFGWSSRTAGDEPSSHDRVGSPLPPPPRRRHTSHRHPRRLDRLDISASTERTPHDAQPRRSSRNTHPGRLDGDDARRARILRLLRLEGGHHALQPRFQGRPGARR